MDGREYTLILSENLDATFYDEIGWNGFKSCRTFEIDGKFVDDDHDDRTWNPVFVWAPEETIRSKSRRGSIRRDSIWTTSSGKSVSVPTGTQVVSCGERARPSARHLGSAVEQPRRRRQRGVHRRPRHVPARRHRLHRLHRADDAQRQEVRIARTPSSSSRTSTTASAV